MKLVVSAVVLQIASLATPGFSLSYLESLNRANPVIASPTGGTVANGASYLSTLKSSSSPSGGGMTSYLDALPKNVPPSTGDPGMQSYTESLSSFAASTIAPEPSLPANPTISSGAIEESAAGPQNSGNYMDIISSVSSAGAPSGPGFTSYLDTLPRSMPATGGAGISTYKDSLPVTNSVVGSGSGLNTYTDNLSNGKSDDNKSFSPFGSAPKSPTFVGSVSGSEIGFTLEASDISCLVEQLRGSGGTIKLSGTINNISFH